ncbi:hypothetical protein TGDOM2_400940 [Toxoplasma gondii GAB2-2007-GAL-DOM2]|uniref:Uncharacterized protein n=1 Tax=Toxoplasma gondii GAB2-2007-GAL-DOM2 TaxID=1130820 RepID=A0A086JJF7_TOXGO|nr:hypothetical protein TGDOM2_400940 [Toxoplasma gondii GAB2-2007-GAL-DOM2]
MEVSVPVQPMHIANSKLNLCPLPRASASPAGGAHAFAEAERRREKKSKTNGWAQKQLGRAGKTNTRRNQKPEVTQRTNEKRKVRSEAEEANELEMEEQQEKAETWKTRDGKPSGGALLRCICSYLERE